MDLWKYSGQGDPGVIQVCVGVPASQYLPVWSPANGLTLLSLTHGGFKVEGNKNEYQASDAWVCVPPL